VERLSIRTWTSYFQKADSVLSQSLGKTASGKIASVDFPNFKVGATNLLELSDLSVPIEFSVILDGVRGRCGWKIWRPCAKVMEGGGLCSLQHSGPYTRWSGDDPEMGPDLKVERLSFVGRSLGHHKDQSKRGHSLSVAPFPKLAFHGPPGNDPRQRLASE